MANHKTRAQFDRARWRLRFLGPAWLLQVSLSLAMLGLFSWRLGDTVKHYDEREKKGNVPTIEFVWEATNVGLSVVVVVATLYEIWRYTAETLTPWTMLFTHVVKTTCAIAILALDIVVYVQSTEKHYSLVGLGLDAVLIVTALALAIYAIITYRRLSAYDDYAHPANVKSFGFRDGPHRSASYSSRTNLRPSLDKRVSSVSSRLSIGSAHTSNSTEQPAAVPLSTLERTPSYYSHERDTQFEEYVARRGSYTGKADVERAVGAEFGWSSPPREAGGTPPGEVPTVVVMGAVQSRPRGASMPRAPSYASDHVLVAVPEEEDEIEHKRGADREALIKDEERRNSDEGPQGTHEVDLAEPHGYQR